MNSQVRFVRQFLIVSFVSLVHSISAWVGEASDVSAYTAQKGVDYSQLSALPASPDTNNGYILQATLTCLGNTVTNATIQPPAQLALALVEQAGNTQFKYRKEYDTLAKLNNHAPSGSYLFAMNTMHDGFKTPSMLLQGDLYPMTPHLLVFAPLQNLDAGSYFNVQWEFLADGAFPDFVQFRIEDSLGNPVFETSDGGSGALNGADTSVLLSPNTLMTNQVYRGTITAAKTITTDTNSYPGATGTAFYYKRLKFTIATTPVASLSDVRLLEAIKMELYEQLSTNAPVPLTNNSFIFHSQVNASESNSVLSVTLTTPPSTETNLAASSSTKFEFEVKSDTLSELNSAYPSGVYTFNTSGRSQGARSTALQLPTEQYLAAAQIVNVEAAQNIDPAKDFVLQWFPVTGAISSDFIHLQIEDDLGTKIFETDDPGQPKALAGTRTSANIPDHTLTSGAHYTARLQFINVTTLDTSSYPGALSMAGFARETRLGVATLGGTLLSPQLTNPHWDSQGFSFVVTGSPNQPYRIDLSTNLANWNTIGTVTTLVTGAVMFTDTNSSRGGLRFYRAAAP